MRFKKYSVIPRYSHAQILLFLYILNVYSIPGNRADRRVSSNGRFCPAEQCQVGNP